MASNITSLLFALTVENMHKLEHYCKTGEEWQFENIDMNTVIHTKQGRFDARIEKIDIQMDSLTKNGSLIVHVRDPDGIKNAIEEDNVYYCLKADFRPRVGKLCLTIQYDGFAI